MTIVKAVVGDEIQNILLGLAESTVQAEDRTIERAWISIASDHIIEYLRSVMPSAFTMFAQFPEIPKDANEEVVIGALQLPMIVIRVMAGPTMDWAGQGLWIDDKYAYYGYNQMAYLMIECWGMDAKEADWGAGLAEQYIMGPGRRGYLLQRGFQNFWTENSSRGQIGFEYWRSFLYEPSFVTIPLFRHQMYLRTKFDVVWRAGFTDVGEFITQINYSINADIGWIDFTGHMVAYLYPESKYFDWFNIGAADA